MSNYYPVYTSIWNDNKFTEYESDRQLVFIYLITNSNCKITGIYKVSIKQIYCSTNIEQNRVKEILETFDKSKIDYDFESGTVFVKNFFKHNLGKGGNPKVLSRTIESSLKLINNNEFINEFNQINSDELNKINAKINNNDNDKNPTVNQQLANSYLTVSQQFNNNSNNNSNSNKDIIDNKNKLKKEKEKILKEKFEELYRLFKDGSKVTVIPFDNFKSRFETCCLDLKDQGGYKFLKQQVIDYLAYLKAHNASNPTFQLSKVAFEVFINSRSVQKSHFCEDWKGKRLALSGEKEEKREEEMTPEELEKAKQSRNQARIFKALTEYGAKNLVNPHNLSEEEKRKIINSLQLE